MHLWLGIFFCWRLVKSKVYYIKSKRASLLIFFLWKLNFKVSATGVYTLVTLNHLFIFPNLGVLFMGCPKKKKNSIWLIFHFLRCKEHFLNSTGAIVFLDVLITSVYLYCILYLRQLLLNVLLYLPMYFCSRVFTSLWRRTVLVFPPFLKKVYIYIYLYLQTSLCTVT